MAVVIGEKDNKDVLEKRKRSERKERLQMNRYIGTLFTLAIRKISQKAYALKKQ